MTSKERRYTEAEKERALNALIAGDSISEIAEQIGAYKATITRWGQQAIDERERIIRNQEAALVSSRDRLEELRRTLAKARRS